MDCQGGEARAKDLAPMDQVQQVKSAAAAIDEPIRSCDNMKWILSFKRDQAKCWFVLITNGLMEVGCLCGITIGGDEMECAR
jgi:hypothetical protein